MLTNASICPQLGGKPDLIIGNYSDGNLVSSLLSHHLNTTQCTIAHALEKTKYPVRVVASLATKHILCARISCCLVHGPSSPTHHSFATP